MEQQGFSIVAEASDGESALGLCRALRPDVAILDIAMPLLNGIDVTRQLAIDCPSTRVILLTMHPEQQFVVAALRARARGYLLKNAPVAQLLQAIEAVMAGETYLSPSISRVLVDNYLSAETRAREPLSAREREVLRLIASGKNMKEIGSLLGISARTAETHRTRIMHKLNIHEVAGLVRYAIQTGLVSIDN